MNQPAPTPRKRRIRYAGTHPRRFADKYKEHDPQRYAADIQKIIASGKTPAGSHRPICLKEVLEVLAPKPGETAVDATLGYGGHALELLRAVRTPVGHDARSAPDGGHSLQPFGRLIGLDADPLELPKTEARLRAALATAGDEATHSPQPESLIVRRTNFAGLPQVLAAEGIAGVDMVLVDLGVSSMQLDNPERGFSYKLDGPLDLRFNPQRGRPASELLAALSEMELSAILQENADEPHAVLIGQAICAARVQNPILTTTALARVVRDALPASHRRADGTDASIRRVFQALRIAVNNELSALETFLRHLPGCLNSGARVAILTFHSGEDRRVKKAFQSGERAGLYARVAHEVIRPSPEEIRSNPRASSAKLRWAERA